MMIILKWWSAMLLTGISVLPLANCIFRRFEDRGWLFSKTLGLFLSAWLLWVANCCGGRDFTQSNAFLAVGVIAAMNYAVCAGLLYRQRRRGTRERERSGGGADSVPAGYAAAWPLIAAEELVLLLLLALAVYVIGFKPEAYGTEKFMDYAFMTSMMRSLKMPFADPWYAGRAINYYYGGQYVAAFLTKMTGSTAGEGYNLMRALVTAFSFCLPAALVYQLMRSRLSAGCAAAGKDDAAQKTGKTAARKARVVPSLAGLFAGVAVAFCGNWHYVIYGLIKSIVSRAQGVCYSYWFPDSTRYIGFNPDLPDKTIHEFPAYSSVLGDLHAHYINILFVVTVTAVVCGWALKQDPRREERLPFLSPEVLLCGLMTGVFRWTNYWDFPIYYVVCGSIFFFVLLRTYRDSILKFVPVMLAIAAVMLGTGYVGALPFTVTFSKISSEIGLTHSHTMPYQLAVLWGLPAACLAGYVVQLIAEYRRKKSEVPRALLRARRMAVPDLIALMLGLCAAGLVFLPEVVYVKDIYSGDHYRANTMFKLTYQAFILFGMFMPYVLVRAIVTARRGMRAPAAGLAADTAPAAGADGAADHEIMEADESAAPPVKERLRRAELHVRMAMGILGSIMLLLTAGYIGKSVSSWFGNIFNPALRIHTDASVFVSESFASDFDAINYLNSEVGGQPTILEAPGDSYSDYERVSVATGLPTVAGWRVHEWLWRENLPELDERIADCGRIYTSSDEGEVRELLAKYDVSYVYVGDLEREKYPELNEELLRGLGELVFESGDGTYIVRLEG